MIGASVTCTSPSPSLTSSSNDYHSPFPLPPPLHPSNPTYPLPRYQPCLIPPSHPLYLLPPSTSSSLALSLALSLPHSLPPFLPPSLFSLRTAEYLGFPSPPPNLQPNANATHGLNFASVGATAGDGARDYVSGWLLTMRSVVFQPLSHSPLADEPFMGCRQGLSE